MAQPNRNTCAKFDNSCHCRRLTSLTNDNNKKWRQWSQANKAPAIKAACGFVFVLILIGLFTTLRNRYSNRGSNVLYYYDMMWTSPSTVLRSAYTITRRSMNGTETKASDYRAGVPFIVVLYSSTNRNIIYVTTAALNYRVWFLPWRYYVYYTKYLIQAMPHALPMGGSFTERKIETWKTDRGSDRGL